MTYLIVNMKILDNLMVKRSRACVDGYMNER